MEIALVDEGYRAATTLNGTPPETITNLAVLQESNIAFQILTHDSQTTQLSLTGDYAVPTELKVPMYRVEVEGDLPVELNFVDYYIGNGGISYADKLAKGTVRRIPADRYGVVYANISTRGIEPGDYSFTIKLYVSGITTEEQLIEVRNIQIGVLAFKQPKAEFDLDVWQQPSNLARAYDVPLWGEEHFELIKKMAKMLAECGETAITVIAAEVPWKGWFSYIIKDYPANLFEYSMVKVMYDNGQLYCDFSVLDRYVEIFMHEGINKDIDVFGLLGVWTPPFFPLIESGSYPEPIVVRYLDKQKGVYNFIRSRDLLVDYIRQLFSHFEEKGWSELVRIFADEPQPQKIDNFRASVRELKQLMPSLRIKVAMDKGDVIEKLRDIVDEPVLSFYTALQSNQSDAQYYICNYPPRPNTYLHSSGYEPRLLGALVYALKMRGVLRWAFNCWPENARTDIRYNVSNLPIGDTCLAYPGNNGDILPSLRLLQMKRGFEDLGLIQMAAEKDAIATEEAVSNLLGRPAREWMIDHHRTAEGVGMQTAEDFVKFRQRLLKIVQG